MGILELRGGVGVTLPSVVDGAQVIVGVKVVGLQPRRLQHVALTHLYPCNFTATLLVY